MPIRKVTIGQIKAARMLLGWPQSVLARRSSVSEPTVKRLEASEGVLGGREETGAKIIGALELAGVEFTDGEGAGVRLRKGGPTGDPSASIKVENLNAENDE